MFQAAHAVIRVLHRDDEHSVTLPKIAGSEPNSVSAAVAIQRIAGATSTPAAWFSSILRAGIIYSCQPVFIEESTCGPDGLHQLLQV